MSTLVPLKPHNDIRDIRQPIPSIQYVASPEIRGVIARISRTEDVVFSPDDTRLAIADYLTPRIFVFSIRVDRTASMPSIALLDGVVLSSPGLKNPHGVAFLDNDHLVVCSRGNDVDVIRIPAEMRGRDVEVQPLETISARGFLSAKVKNPGSVDSYKLSDHRYRILVCSNTWHLVTSHVVTIGDSISIGHEGVLLEHGLRIPDGITVSSDAAWIAVSNHVTGTILIYKNTPELDRNTAAVGTLRGIVCPHGVRFSPDGNRLFAADAASPYLHVFESTRGAWEGVRDPSQSIRLVDDATFHLGRIDAREGGIKGIDLDSGGSILATTFKDGVLGFYSVDALLTHRTNADPSEMLELCRLRDESIARDKPDVLKHQWTLKNRLIQVARQIRPVLGRSRYAMRIGAGLFGLRLRNRWSRESILDPAGPVVSLTSYEPRLELVFFGIESIALGHRKPSRMVLWLDDDAYADRPQTLRRLESRGLEIYPSENLGPHKKYYPYIDRTRAFQIPLVTADDDVLYPRDWLQQLIEAHAADPSAIHCHRAHRIGVRGGRLLPYLTWDPCTSTSPSHLNFVTGVSGVIYPPRFLEHLKRQGKAFAQCCPASDDIWLTVNALRAGFKVAQLKDTAVHFETIPGSQVQTLSASNVEGGGNQRQLLQTFCDSDLSMLSACGVSEGR
jgi:hypothetical protein